MIDLLPVTSDLVRAALNGGWLEDTRINRLRGFGSDGAGLAAASQSFLNASSNGMWGIYDDVEPCGWITIDRKGESAEIDIYVGPDHRRKGIGRHVVEQAVGALLRDGLERVGVRVPEFNKVGIRFFEQCGFVPEGKTWAAMKVDGRLTDTVNLVATRSVWQRKGKSHVE